MGRAEPLWMTEHLFDKHERSFYTARAFAQEGEGGVRIAPVRGRGIRCATRYTVCPNGFRPDLKSLPTSLWLSTAAGPVSSPNMGGVPAPTR